MSDLNIAKVEKMIKLAEQQTDNPLVMSKLEIWNKAYRDLVMVLKLSSDAPLATRLGPSTKIEVIRAIAKATEENDTESLHIYKGKLAQMDRRLDHL